MPASTDSYSSRELDPSFIEIRREKHRWRHWTWSGIFPLYGGFIPDPHMEATRVFTFDELTQAKLPQPARYQGFDVNPWFKDETTERVVAIEAAGNVYAFHLARSDLAGLKYGFTRSDPVYATSQNDMLVFVTSLNSLDPVLIEIQLPLSHDAQPKTHRMGTSGWRTLGDELLPRCAAREINPEFCERLNRYEKGDPFRSVAQ